MHLIAHRGASFDAPENTLAAVQLAWRQDADAVEVDVHLTADEELAVIHDADTQRTTGVPGAVAAATLETLQALDAGGWKSPAFAGERIPVLREVLATVPPGKRIFVELKADGPAVAALVRTLARSRLAPEQVVVIAFALRVARQAKQLLPRCEVCWIVASESPEGRLPRAELIARARDARVDGLDLEAAWVDEAWVRLAHAAGLKLYVWTVDDRALAEELTAFGVDGITTNRPGWLRTGLAGGAWNHFKPA